MKVMINGMVVGIYIIGWLVFVLMGFFWGVKMAYTR